MIIFRFLFMVEHVMPLCLTISWVYSVAMLVQSIVYEKERRLKEVGNSGYGSCTQQETKVMIICVLHFTSFFILIFKSSCSSKTGNHMLQFCDLFYFPFLSFFFCPVHMIGLLSNVVQ